MTHQRSDDSGPQRVRTPAQSRESLWRDILVEIYTNRNYQQTRRRVFEFRDNLVKVISLVTASYAYMAFKPGAANFVCQGLCNFMGFSYESFFAFLMLSIVIANCWCLVFKWGDKARDAVARHDAWCRLEEQVHAVGLENYTGENLSEWKKMTSTLSVGEPAPNMYYLARAESDARKVLRHHAIPREYKTLSARFLAAMRDLRNFVPSPFLQ